MLFLKPANLEDAAQEYACYGRIPADENGFTNPYPHVSRADFERTVLPEMVAHARGEQLPEGYVPQTSYFLWDDTRVVGLFRLRHYLNNFLRDGPGHVGYYICPDCRGRGYATAGLRLLCREAAHVILEDELYLSCYKTNPASLHVQQNAGAYIHHEDEVYFYTRIPLNQE